MHKYLRAIGFSEFNTKKDIDDFLNENVKSENLVSSTKTVDNRIIGQHQIIVAQTLGLSVMCEEDQDKVTRIDYYFPFAKGYDYTMIQECTIERHSDKESFAGIIDDDRLGIALIFHLVNINEYKKVIQSKNLQAIKIDRIFLSALSLEGKIILPLEKKSIEVNNFQSRIVGKKNYDNDSDIDNVDDNHFDGMVVDDFTLFNTVNERYKKEDLYSIVETSIVPYGIECDKYLIVAEILSVSYKQNSFTKETLIEMRLVALGLQFNLVINEKDLKGVPKPGRRFRGVIWLQGDVEFLKINRVREEEGPESLQNMQ